MPLYKKSQHNGKIHKTISFVTNNKIVLFTAFFTISMWCLQFLSDYANNDCPAKNLGELLAFSLYHTLKAFGADDNFLVGMEYLSFLLKKKCR